MQNPSKGLLPHVVLSGNVNAGKSTLFNRLLGQNLALVSPLPGTTTDTVSKACELPGLGAIVLVDTPGLGDNTALGSLRIEASEKAFREADLILFVTDGDTSPVAHIRSCSKAPILPVVISSVYSEKDPDLSDVEKACGRSAVRLGESIDPLLARIKMALEPTKEAEEKSITGDLAKPGDLVLLVMPQDSEAPKGRLILPQVQTIRELLDKKCLALSVQPSELPLALSRLKEPPALIITDSQKFAEVEKLCPKGVPLTSFSVLMSAYKGDLKQLLSGAAAIDRLTTKSRILIAEACTHVPNGEDIGTVKIPNLLRKRFGQALHIDNVSGKDFPRDLSGYHLVIHCAACMFNRAHLLSRQSEAEDQSVPMTNYGIAIAKLLGILPKVALPLSSDSESGANGCG